MTWLISMGLANAVLVVPLAALAWGVGRFSRHPALAHVLWLVVLAKLVTPPLVEFPVGWQLDLTAISNPAPNSPEQITESAKVALVCPTNDSLAPSSAVVSCSRDVCLPDEATPSLASRTIANKTETTTATHVDKSRATASAPVTVAAPRFALSAASTIRLVAIVWTAGSACILMLFVIRAWRFHRFLSLASREDERLCERAAQLARAVGLPRSVKVVVVESVVSPLLWGVGNSVRLVFPAELARRLDERACDSLLLHELAHYSRGDHWVRLLELAVQALYWWHPVVWLARHEIEAAEEQCCDAWVVQRQEGSRRSYAEALLATLDFLCDEPSPLPPAACGLGEAPFLRKRLTQIMRGEIASRLSPATKVFVLAGALIVLPLGPALFASSSRPGQGAKRSSAANEKTQDPTENQFENVNPRQPVEVTSTSVTPATPTPAEPAVPENYISSASPLRLPAELLATAVSPCGRYRLEARTDRKTALVDANADRRIDLSAHRITCAGFSKDGRSFASGHEDSIVRVWDSESWGVKLSLKGCEAEITSVAISPDGTQVAAADAEGRVLVWNLGSGDETARLARQDGAISCVRWSNRGDRLAICVGDWNDKEHAAFLVWTPGEDAGLVRHVLGVPAGAADWLAGDKGLVVAAWDGQAQLWNIDSGEPVSEVRLAKDLISAAAWSPDCPLLPRRPAEVLLTGIK